MTDIVVIAHDIRSTHNVGSLLRTCEGIGVGHIYFTGYTPYPATDDDERLPHIARKLTAQIHKTALDAEVLVKWTHMDSVETCIAQLHEKGYVVAALEQGSNSIPLPDYKPPQKSALLLGREVEGIDAELLRRCDVCIEIPMFGNKESFNVVQAAAMALYQLRFG
jgi:23S rRNA (guanosine2251-2'-O)-methyltransferase